MAQYCDGRVLWLNTVVAEYCGSILWWQSIVAQYCGGRVLWLNTVVAEYCGSILWWQSIVAQYPEWQHMLCEGLGYKGPGIECRLLHSRFVAHLHMKVALRENCPVKGGVNGRRL